MKLVDLSITEFAKVLGSDAPAPGGGSAAALSAANGISLTKMVCELTIGKKKYAEFEDHIKGVHEKSAHLQDQLLEAIDKDTEAFNVVSAVFDLPKETEEEKVARREAMQKAWLNVLINISGIKDQDFVQEYHSKGLELLQTGSELADNIYQSILESLS